MSIKVQVICNWCGEFASGRFYKTSLQHFIIPESGLPKPKAKQRLAWNICNDCCLKLTRFIEKTESPKAPSIL